MHLSLEMNVKQQLAISPQLQQAIRLLQLSSLELHTEIQQIVERNPLLELDDTTSINEPIPNLLNSNFTNGTISRSSADYDDRDLLANITQNIDLHSYLHSQINLMKLTKNQEIIANSIVDAINNDGYLTASIDELHKTLETQKINCNKKQITDMLKKLQHCEPAGVGARDIKECILLQLFRQDLSDTHVMNAITMIEHYFSDYAKKEYKKICRKLDWSMETLDAASQIIKNVNPRPGAQFTQLPNHYVTPDVIVRKINDEWCIQLNPMNSLTPRLNKNYLSIINQNKNDKDSQFFKDNLKEAKWLINSVETRHQTLLKVTKAIMDYQNEFLDNGILRMKPLRLLTIAEKIDMHESTVSRVTNNKYVFTPHGIFELKEFFSSEVQSENGVGVSSTAIKALIKKYIDLEDKQKPFSDNAIMTFLSENGIHIARRTVTKYREAMSIGSSTERKM